MTALTLTALVPVMAMTIGAQDYDQAYQAMQEEGKPLLVLIGADWCPGCQVMKQSTMKTLDQSGQLNGVSYAVVNTDRDVAISNKLKRGGTIPQLVMFTRTDTGWKRRQLTGAHSSSQVQQFIRNGLAAHQQAVSAPIESISGK